MMRKARVDEGVRKLRSGEKVRKKVRRKILSVLALVGIFVVTWTYLPVGSATVTANAETVNAPENGVVPVAGMVTLVDLGADACIPCKMMAPILAKLEKQYRGKAAVVFIDVWKNKDQARRFGVRVIPTQIFFDKEGTEVYRHIGFMGEPDMVKQLQKMGVN